MIVSSGGGHALVGPFKWFTSRLAIYGIAAFLSGQAFIGLAGFGKGGEWVLASLACEMFCLLWFMSAPETRRALKLWIGVRSQVRAQFKIISVTSDMANVSAAKASGAESFMLGRLLQGSKGTGICFVWDSGSNEVLGVLLSRDEYELLNSAAMIARDPERLGDPPPGYFESGVDVENVFGESASE